MEEKDSVSCDDDCIIICEHCDTEKLHYLWYCKVCGYPYSNDDCDD